jgi:hypothetical protein
VDLKFQFEWQGSQLQNLFILVCDECYDVPQEQLRAITLPADPVPIFYPSVESFQDNETDYRTISTPTALDPITGIPVVLNAYRTTQDCQNRTVRPYGRPVSFSQNAVMPYNGGVQKAYGVPLQLLSVTSNGTATVQVTCSAPHGLQTNDQVSIEGLAFAAANGFYSVTVLGATTFTYMVYGSVPTSSTDVLLTDDSGDFLTTDDGTNLATSDGSVPAQALLTSMTSIVTVLVGLPYGYQQIAQIEGPTPEASTPPNPAPPPPPPPAPTVPGAPFNVVASNA